MTTTPVDEADRRAREVVDRAWERWRGYDGTAAYVVGELRAALADAYRQIETLKLQLEKSR
jgi:hypothetical protein